MSTIAAGTTRGGDTNNYVTIEARITPTPHHDVTVGKTGANTLEPRVVEQN